MEYLKAFLVGGGLCLLGQILIDKTKLTPARILVSYVVIGVVLGGIGLYPKLVDFAGAGATVPLLAQYDVSASQFLTVKHQIIQFFSQTIVQIALAALVVLIAAIWVWWKFFRPNRRYGSRSGRRNRRRAYRGRRR